MSKKRYNYNQNKPKKPQSNSGMNERKKKIYAYILAGFIIFWNIASVLGIVGFVRSFAKNDYSSEEPQNGYTVSRMAERERKQASTQVVYQTIDLHVEGVTVPPSHVYNNYECFSAKNAFLRCSSDSKLYFGWGSLYELPYDEDVNVDLPVYAYRITGGNPYMISIDTPATVKWFGYRGAFSNTLDCYVYDVSVTAFVSRVESSYVENGEVSSVSLRYSLNWYDNSVYLGTTTFYITFSGLIYHGTWDFVYPYNGIKETIYNTDTTATDREISCGRIVLPYRSNFRTGYNNGVAEANTYTFENLLTNVIDVPIQAFTSLFEFELLGVNLASFFFGLLSVCTIIAVIKLFI